MPAPIPFGNYELIERIAEGGMAEVWRARSRGVAGFEKTVVIKRVLPSLLSRPGFAELLVREAKIAAQLSHPNIVQIYDLGEQDGSYFIAMEFLRGRDLAAALSYRGPGETPLGLGQRLWIASEVAKALDYAHRARFDDGKPMSIVHRDVSPQNVLLGFEGEVKVADFGIARADEPGLGRGEDPKILRGKYAYMSPEQARGESLDRRSDIFSFGILLYEIITRKRMFRGASSADTLDLVRNAKLPDFSAHLPIPELSPILRRALSAKKEDRQSSTLEIHQDLMSLIFAIGKPVGQTDLAASMHRMFPPEDRLDPNKLRVDLMIRAYDDATAASDPGRSVHSKERTVEATSQTRALPTSKRLRSENRRLAFLAAEARPGDDALFDGAVELAGGSVLGVHGGLRLAAFGLAGIERAVGHAVRGALELRRTSRLQGPTRLRPSPPMAVLSAEGRILEGVAVEPSEEALARAAELVKAADSGDICVDAALRPELGRDFRFTVGEGALLVDGFRSRRDRDAGALRLRAPLVGRRAVLRELSGVLLDAAGGRGTLVHVEGAPGVGKSRLLAELRSSAAPRDFVFVHGRADEADMDRSFGALADLVQDLCGIEPEDAPAQRFEKVERLRVLGLNSRQVRLVGELIGLAYPVVTDERVGRPRGIEIALSVRRAIRKLSEDRVVVLALEDLQWMDDATRQVLPLLVDGLVPGRVLVLVTRRPGSVGPLPAGGRTIVLAPLARDPTGRLLAHYLGVRAVEPELAEHVRIETGGVPAWIELVAEPLKDQVVVEDGVARSSGQMPPIALPNSVRAVVSARIERLRARERSMLRVAAVVGGTVDVKLLSSIEGLIGHTERPPLRRLWVGGLLVSDDDRAAAPERLGAWGGDEEDERLPTAVRVPSELLRRAVIAELDEGELERMHSRVVATLERLGSATSLEGFGKLAYHAERSVDPRRAPDYHISAGAAAVDEAERPRAAQHFIEAARLRCVASGNAADPVAFELSLRAAAVALEAGDVELAGAALAPTADVVGRVDKGLAVRRAILVARQARQDMRTSDALAALTSMEAVYAEVDSGLRDEARLLLARACIDHGAIDRALSVLASIVESSDGARLGVGLAYRAIALAYADHLDLAEEAVNQALALTARLGDTELRYVSLAALAVLEEARGEFEEAAAHYREAAEVAQDVADFDELARLYAHAAAASLSIGDIEDATLRVDDAGTFAERTGQEPWKLVVSALRGALAIREHADASHVPGLVRAVERLEKLGRASEAALAVEMLVYAHLALGDPGAAGRTLARAAVHAERAGNASYVRRLGERRAALSAP